MVARFCKRHGSTKALRPSQVGGVDAGCFDVGGLQCAGAAEHFDDLGAPCRNNDCLSSLWREVICRAEVARSFSSDGG